MPWTSALGCGSFLAFSRQGTLVRFGQVSHALLHDFVREKLVRKEFQSTERETNTWKIFPEFSDSFQFYVLHQ